MSINSCSFFHDVSQAVGQHLRRYRRNFQLTLSIAVIASTIGVGVASTSEISWDDLLSPSMDELAEKSRALQERFRELSPEQQAQYRSIADELALLERLEDGTVKKGDLSKRELDTLDAELSKKTPGAMEFFDEVTQINEKMETENGQINPSLNGKTIRMPGYVLPLQTEDGKVFEFMLVPYVGACVHTPPPPMNQLVYVKSSEGFSSDDMYTPVWVEGVMSTEQASYDLSYRDGNRDIEAGYILDAELVEVYER